MQAQGLRHKATRLRIPKVSISVDASGVNYLTEKGKTMDFD
jgi:hypothetical protein